LFERLLKERNTFYYPPITRLIKITLKHKDQNVLNRASASLATILKSRLNNLVLGPEYPLIARIKNLYQKDILIKLPINKQMSEHKHFILHQTKELCKNIDFKAIKISIDVDAG
jgi:primosomal protein N' (replication factor Y)